EFPLPRPASTLFPYTTLFRSTACASCCGTAPAGRGSSPASPTKRCWLSCRSGAVAAPAPLLQWGDAPAAPTTPRRPRGPALRARSEEHTSELQSRENLVCRLL